MTGNPLASPVHDIVSQTLGIVAELRASQSPRAQEDEDRLWDFSARLTDAGQDVMRLADLLAEAALMTRQARGNHSYRVPRPQITGAEMVAAYCLDAARLAFEAVRR